MPVTIVRLGTPRLSGEGLRIGTVRRPPRGVPKSDYAAENWYDVWLPNLAPSDALFKWVRSRTDDEKAWRAFERQYRAEMKKPDAAHLLALLAALSHRTDFSVGCYCEDERRCHRSALRQLLEEHGALVR